MARKDATLMVDRQPAITATFDYEILIVRNFCGAQPGPLARAEMEGATAGKSKRRRRKERINSQL